MKKAFSLALIVCAMSVLGTKTQAAIMTAGIGGVAQWTYDDTVPVLTTQISVASVSQAFLQTLALDGATLTLVQQAVPFSTPQVGPGAAVGEFMTANFVTGTELINIAVLTPGLYTFEAQWNVLSSTPQTAQFSIQFGEVPEPASLALIGLGGLALLRRRRA